MDRGRFFSCQSIIMRRGRAISGGGDNKDLAWALTIVGICVIVALFIYAMFGTGAPATGTTNNYYDPPAGRRPTYMERFSSDSACANADYKLLFFSMEQCPHCVRFRPEWSKCVQQVSAMPKVCTVEVNATDSSRVKEYNVDGFPTIILEDVRSGNRTNYDGARSADAVIAFISQKTA